MTGADSMQQDDFPMEADVLFSTIHPSSPTEDCAGHLNDIFVCQESGHFFTVENMQLQITPRSTSATSTFLCPVCLDVPLKITAGARRQPDVPVAQCPECPYNTSQCNVSSAIDLLHRSSQPYPWLTEHFKALKLKQQAALAGSGVNGSSGSASVIERRDSVRSVRSDASRTPSAVGATASTASTFTSLQKAHEEKVFASFMPNDSVAEVARDDSSSSQLEAFMGEVHSNELVDIGERLAAGVLMRRFEVPRWKSSLARVAVKSPFSGKSVTSKWDSFFLADDYSHITAERVFPKIRLFIGGVSVERESREQFTPGRVRVTFSNERDNKVRIWLANYANESETKACEVGAKESTEVVFDSFTFTDTNADSNAVGARGRDKLVKMKVSALIKEGSRSGEARTSSKSLRRDVGLGRHEWQLCLFARCRTRSSSATL